MQVSTQDRSISDELDKMLSALCSEVEWCVAPVAGATIVDREREWKAQEDAKQAILNLINEARIDELKRHQAIWGMSKVDKRIRDSLTDRLAQLRKDTL